MNHFVRRVWITACVMCICYAGVCYVRAGYRFEVAPLSHGLESLPQSLDGWQGKDIPLDEHVKEILNAQKTLSRVYRDEGGASVALNVSAWLRPETVTEAAPHIPKICYTNAGWAVLEERLHKVASPRGELPITVLLLKRHEEVIVVGYWYQLGNDYFNTAGEARHLHQKLWGKRTWPATIKVLMQTSAANIDRGLPRIEKFALLIQPHLSDESRVTGTEK